ncbi:MAG: P1 family peptidase [Pseudomonadota bacterium]
MSGARPGRRNLITDVDGLRVGNAGDAGLKSGVTVLTADTAFTAAVHVMGGAPGTRETDLLAPDRLVQHADALVLSGGSGFGLDAASGVVDALREAGRGYPTSGTRVPIVPAAILMDLANGGDKGWAESPYPALGRKAYAGAAPAFALGTHGAGMGATCADVKGGLGSASVALTEGYTIGALAAVNAVGSPLIPGGAQFWAAPFEMSGEFGGLGVGSPVSAQAAPPLKTTAGPGEATTIAIVATDAALTKGQAQRMAVAAHGGIARALVPSHTLIDGDLVFAVSTGRLPLRAAVPDAIALGHWASVCLARAIARAVYLAEAAPGDTKPAWQALHGRRA